MDLLEELQHQGIVQPRQTEISQKSKEQSTLVYHKQSIYFIPSALLEEWNLFNIGEFSHLT